MMFRNIASVKRLFEENMFSHLLFDILKIIKIDFVMLFVLSWIPWQSNFCIFYINFLKQILAVLW